MIKDSKGKTKVIVIGLDGADWKVLKPLIETNELPFLRKLLTNGAYGSLESIYPPLSVPAWRCYSSGKYPSKIGVFSFMKFDRRSKKFKVVNSKDFRTLDIWDYLGIYGYKVCVYKMFSTHPAKKVNGIMISDLPIYKNAFYPTYLKRELETKFGKLMFDIAFTTDRVKTYRGVLKEIAKDIQILLYLIKKFNPDFVHISIAHTDGIQHFFWADMLSKNSPYKHYIKYAWKIVDKLLETLVSKLKVIWKDKNIYIVLMSDHGFTAVRYHFNIGDWLIEKGYLRLRIKGFFLRALFNFLDFEKTYTIIELLLKFLRKIGIKQAKWGLQFNIKAQTFSDLIDFKKSLIIPLDPQQWYINPEYYHNENQRIAIFTKIKEELSKILTPEGDKAIWRVIDGKKLYNGRGNPPDIIILSKGIDLSTMIYSSRRWIKQKSGKWSGMHDLYGIFLISGPGIKKSFEIKKARIIDIAPTIMYLFNIPIPSSMDGKVLYEAFENLFLKSKPKAHIVSDKHFIKLLLKKRLKRLFR